MSRHCCCCAERTSAHQVLSDVIGVRRETARMRDFLTNPVAFDEVHRKEDNAKVWRARLRPELRGLLSVVLLGTYPPGSLVTIKSWQTLVVPSAPAAMFFGHMRPLDLGFVEIAVDVVVTLDRKPDMHAQCVALIRAPEDATPWDGR